MPNYSRCGLHWITVILIAITLIGCDSSDSQVGRMVKFCHDNVNPLTLTSEQAEALARFALEYDPQDGERYFYQAVSESGLFGMAMDSYDQGSKRIRGSVRLRKAFQIAQASHQQWNANFIQWMLINKSASADSQASTTFNEPQHQVPVQIISPTHTPTPRYVLKSPVSVPVPYGAMTLPAKTEVRVLRQTGNAYRVQSGKLEFDVKADQLLSIPQ